MKDSIRELALDGQFADVTIEVEGQRIRCHRIILAASSKYFKYVIVRDRFSTAVFVLFQTRNGRADYTWTIF